MVKPKITPEPAPNQAMKVRGPPPLASAHADSASTPAARHEITAPANATTISTADSATKKGICWAQRSVTRLYSSWVSIAHAAGPSAAPIQYLHREDVSVWLITAAPN